MEASLGRVHLHQCSVTTKMVFPSALWMNWTFWRFVFIKLLKAYTYFSVFCSPQSKLSVCIYVFNFRGRKSESEKESTYPLVHTTNTSKKLRIPGTSQESRTKSRLPTEVMGTKLEPSPLPPGVLLAGSWNQAKDGIQIKYLNQAQFGHPNH